MMCYVIQHKGLESGLRVLYTGDGVKTPRIIQEEYVYD